MKVKLTSLILDWTLYPRHQVSEQHVADLARAMRAGEVLPPVIADKKTRKLVDGWNRHKANERVFGEDAEIECEFRSYKDDNAMLEAAVALNTAHGDNLDRWDQKMFIGRALERGLDVERIAHALHTTLEFAAKLQTEFANPPRGAVDADTIKGGSDNAKPESQVPLKRGFGHLKARTLSVRQMEGMQKEPGMASVFVVDRIINRIQNDLMDWSDKVLLQRLEVLQALLSEVLKKHIAA